MINGDDNMLVVAVKDSFDTSQHGGYFVEIPRSLLNFYLAWRLSAEAVLALRITKDENELSAIAIEGNRVQTIAYMEAINEHHAIELAV